MCANNLAKVCTWKRNVRGSNLRPLSRTSNGLTIRPTPSGHTIHRCLVLNWRCIDAVCFSTHSQRCASYLRKWANCFGCELNGTPTADEEQLQSCAAIVSTVWSTVLIWCLDTLHCSSTSWNQFFLQTDRLVVHLNAAIVPLPQQISGPSLYRETMTSAVFYQLSELTLLHWNK